MRMINEANEVLKDLLRYNDVMREQEEYLQRQEEAWIEDKQMMKAQEEAEEQKKQSEMDASMNTEQQVPEYKQATKSAIKHANEQEPVHMAQKYN